MEQNKEQNSIRLLRADEIECRIGTVSEKGISLLLYKDARADMKILDEVFGSMNWQRKHEVIGGNLYCTVSVWDAGKEQWISKMDVGTESNTEKTKGQASDSFKWACVCLGIGRELYTAPFIWISSNKVRIEKRQDGKLYTQDKFTVRDISYNEENRVITGLVIVNRDGNRVYELKPGKTAVPDQTEERGTGKPADGMEEKFKAHKGKGRIVLCWCKMSSRNRDYACSRRFREDVLPKACPTVTKAYCAYHLIPQGTEDWRKTWKQGIICGEYQEEDGTTGKV